MSDWIEQHSRSIWVHYALMMLGIWLVFSHASFGYTSRALVASDILSGILLLLFALLSLNPKRLWAPWASAAVGVWLQFAPLLLWAPDAAAYLNNTLSGAFIIALAILIPGMPGEPLFRQPGPELPPGWSYNPSSWWQRAPLIVLALAGWFISRYLAAFQLGYIDSVWDPIFGKGTEIVLTSEVSKAFPVSDAGLGATAYTFELLLAFLGARDRWRTNPSTVLVFGLLVVPLGITHLVLVTLMPVLVGAWCALCLLTAFLMLVMVPMALDEIVATCQFLRHKQAQGESLPKLLFKGGGLDSDEQDLRAPPLNAPPQQSFPAMFWGVNLPWNLVLATAIGCWIIAAPPFLEAEGAAANSNFLTGALIVTVAVVALGEVSRAVRFLNIPLAIWIIVAPWILSGETTPLILNNLAAGLVLILLSLRRGRIIERCGSWQPFIR
jgi:hypothetical protein